MIKFSPLILVIGLSATGALAQSFEAGIIDQLRREGYGEIKMNTTFLGRVRIVALGSKGQREIVLNPRTGEVLRDLWHLAPAQDDRSGGGGHSGPAPLGPPPLLEDGHKGGGDDRPPEKGGGDDPEDHGDSSGPGGGPGGGHGGRDEGGGGDSGGSGGGGGQDRGGKDD